MHVIGHDDVCMEHVMSDFGSAQKRILDMAGNFRIAHPARSGSCGVELSIGSEKLFSGRSM